MTILIAFLILFKSFTNVINKIIVNDQVDDEDKVKNLSTFFVYSKKLTR